MCTFVTDEMQTPENGLHINHSAQTKYIYEYFISISSPAGYKYFKETFYDN